MSDAAVERRGTGVIPGSDVYEMLQQLNKGGQYWVLSSPTFGVSTGNAAASITKFHIAGTNRVHQVATATLTFTGITIATGNYGLVACYRTVAGTNIIVAGTTGATIGAATMPDIPATAMCFGLILLSTTGASAFTGATTELDGTNANALFFNLTGAAPFAISTAPITAIPG